MDLRFSGHDEDVEELFEVAGVRSFIQQLDVEFPYWLYYMSKETNALQAVILSFLPPFLTAEAKAVEFPKRLEQLLTRRWIPALNAIADFAGLEDDEVDLLTDQAVDYIISGPGQ